MTIAVQITNDDKTRILQIEQVEFNRKGSTGEVKETYTKQPGESRTYHVHLLRELRLTEETPR